MIPLDDFSIYVVIAMVAIFIAAIAAVFIPKIPGIERWDGTVRPADYKLEAWADAKANSYRFKWISEMRASNINPSVYVHPDPIEDRANMASRGFYDGYLARAREEQDANR